MKYKNLLIGLLSSLVTLLFASTYSAQAANKSPRGYWVDSSGTIVRSGTGLCVRTGTWEPADAVVPGCDGVPLQPAQAVTTENKTAAEVPAAAASAQRPTSAPVTEPVASKSEETTKAAVVPPPIAKVSLTTDASFGFDQSSLRPEGLERLKKLHAELQNAKVDSILATGHTDSIGKASYNKKLSIRRAQAVKDYLVKLGIPSERIFIDGKGATQPVASNKTSQGRARNRRVDVEVIGTKAP
jgi:OmpA-OmpF porin, OOP family